MRVTNVVLSPRQLDAVSLINISLLLRPESLILNLLGQ